MLLLSAAAEDAVAAVLFDAFDEFEHADMLMAARIAKSDVVAIGRIGFLPRK
jgi:hypothetical protein